MIANTSHLPVALVVEDDDKLATIFTSALNLAGFDVRHAVNGRQAMDQVNSLMPAIVLLDLHLPEVSGDKILHYIRSADRLKDMVIILATADSAMADSLEEKADFVLQKPISFTQLRDLAIRIRSTLRPNPNPPPTDR